MSSYTVTTNFLSKDALISGNPLKLVKGADLTVEFNNIATAVNSKVDGAYQTGTFTGTFTGFTSGTTQTCTYQITNGVCTLSIPNFTNTSNSTAMTMTGLPAVCQPATLSAYMPCLVSDNSQTYIGAAIISPSGTITFYRQTGGVNLSGTGFTAAAAKGVQNAALTYSLL